MEDFKSKLFEIINSTHSDKLLYIKFKTFCNDSTLKSHIRSNSFIFIFKNNCAMVFDNSKENNFGLLLALVDESKKMQIFDSLEDIKLYFTNNYKNITERFISLS